MAIYEESLNPESLAAKLAEYISDPSTIRARVLDHYGTAPSVERCRELRKKVEGRKQKHITYAGEKFTIFCQRHDGPYEIAADGFDRCVTCAKEKRIAEKERELRHIRTLQEQRRLREMASEKIAGQVVKSALAAIKASKKPEHEQIIAKVCKIFDISESDLFNQSRVQRYVDARATLARLLRMRGWSYPRIAKMFPRPGTVLGHMDHTSIVHLDHTLDIRMKRNKVIGKAIEALSE